MKMIDRIYCSKKSKDRQLLLRTFISSIASSPNDNSGNSENENVVCDSKSTSNHLTHKTSVNKE
jgi:hypothetical protein